MFDLYGLHDISEPSIPIWLANDLGLPCDTPLARLGNLTASGSRGARGLARFRPNAADDAAAALDAVPLFADLPRKRRRRASRLAQTMRVPANTVLALEDEPARDFFVVLDGRLDVRQDDKLVATRGPGSHAGAPALLAGRNRTTTLVAATPVRSLVLPQRQFRRLLDEMPEVTERLLADIGRATLTGMPHEHAA